MLLVTAVAALSSAGTTTMVVNDNIADVDDSDHAPQGLASRHTKTTMTRYYPLLALLPLLLMAALAAGYYIYR